MEFIFLPPPLKLDVFFPLVELPEFGYKINLEWREDANIQPKWWNYEKKNKKKLRLFYNNWTISINDQKYNTIVLKKPGCPPSLPPDM